jgi:hypothetical protein
MSFSLLGIMIIFLCGVLICATSVLIEPATTFFQKRFRPQASRYAELEWRANHVLHLQRLAHDDEAQWTRGLWGVPITRSTAMLSRLDEEDVERLPRLLKPGQHLQVGVHGPVAVSRKETESDATSIDAKSSPTTEDIEHEEKRNSLVAVREVRNAHSNL